tara:strand:- start:545 stop:988 length:444 start_codon:yes stop_codon:yes gene_type:complete
MKKPGISSSGILSLLIGTALVGRVLYEKLIKKHKGDDKKYVINNTQDESTRNEIIKKSKIEGYTIFMNTVLEYLIEVDPQIQSFADFMRIKWASDYIIYIENENNETKNKNISCKRSYKSWLAMYYAIKKNILIDVDDIIKIGERDI